MDSTPIIQIPQKHNNIRVKGLSLGLIHDSASQETVSQFSTQSHCIEIRKTADVREDSKNRYIASAETIDPIFYPLYAKQIFRLVPKISGQTLLCLRSVNKTNTWPVIWKSSAHCREYDCVLECGLFESLGIYFLRNLDSSLTVLTAITKI